MNKFDFVIGGYPRSGTTLLRMLIDSHPECFVGPETKLFYPKSQIDQICVDWYSNYLNYDFKNNYNEHNIVSKLKESFPYINFFGEKSPRNSAFYEDIKNDYKIIHIYREPDDVFQSYKKFKPHLDYNTFKKDWNNLNYVLFENWDNLLIINYKNLCENLYQNLDKIFDFIGANTNINYDNMRLKYTYETVNINEWENKVNVNNIIGHDQ